MTLADLRDHLNYNEWANARVLSMVAELPPEHLSRDLRSSFPSIRDTIAHIVGGEWVWLSRWTGESPSTFPEWIAGDSLDDLAARLTAIQAQRTAWFAALEESDLARPRAYRLFNGTEDAQPLEAQILHIVNHSTYHRGQIATMMRQVGAKAISTDRIAYSRAKTHT